MEHQRFCQSCSMPLDNPELKGTELDGTKNDDYCIYCYKNGVFTNPEMTLDEMKERVRLQMEQMKMDAGLIEMTQQGLPYLRRWHGTEMNGEPEKALNA